MGNAAQKIVEQGHFYTPIPQKPHLWLIQQVGAGAASLWTEMLGKPEGYNHYPRTLASDLRVTVRTIQRLLKKLLEVGAVFKLSRKLEGRAHTFYYRPIQFPKSYVEPTSNVVPFPQKSPPPPVDKPCKRTEQKTNKTTVVTHLIKWIKPHSKNIYTTSTITDSIREDQNLSSGCGFENNIDYQKYFSRLCSRYPAHKVPYDNPRYLESCFSLFQQLMLGEPAEYVDGATDLMITDVQHRLRHCCQWVRPEIQPSLYGYLKNAVWKRPVYYSEPVREEIRAEYGVGPERLTDAQQTAPTGLRIGHSDWADDL